MQKAPINKASRTQLVTDTRNIRAAANRKQVTLDAWEESRERAAAEQHFELGCWLYYYSKRIGKPGPQGLQDRINCACLLFMSGFTRPGYQFFTIFSFGERQFDAIFEMGDAKEVIEGLRIMLPNDKSGMLDKAFDYFGWPKEAVTT